MSCWTTNMLIKKLFVWLTDVFLKAKLKFLAFHLLNFLIVEFVPVSGVSILHVSNVVARICTDASMNQHCTQLVQRVLIWRTSQYRNTKAATSVSPKKNKSTDLGVKTFLETSLFLGIIPCFPSRKGPMSSCSGKLMKVLSFFLWPVCLEEEDE